MFKTCMIQRARKSHHSTSSPFQSKKRPFSRMLVLSTIASSCCTARSRLNSFSGGTFCTQGEQQITFVLSVQWRPVIK